jgi:predicted glycosyltransferase
MRILIDILHPAHVHFFRNFHNEMADRGNELFFTARDKDRSLDLLREYDLPFVQISQQARGGGGLAIEMAQRTRRLLKVMGEFRPDVLTGIMGPSIAVAGRLKRVPAVVFYDTEFARQTNWFVYPLAHSVCTPDCYQGHVRGRHVRYAGYHELAYLHPQRFTPDPNKLKEFGLDPDEPYALVRFVSWQAVHDRRERGLTLAQKSNLVDILRSRGLRVQISSEAPLPRSMAEMEVKGPVGQIHHVLAHAQLCVGESATMSSESAVLGVPAVFIATTSRGYIDDEQRRYGLVRRFTDDQYQEAVAEVEKLCSDAPGAGQAARQRLLEEKIDVTSWMVEYFESQLAKA